MKFQKTALDGVILVAPTLHGDDRGFFVETYQEQRYRSNGIDVQFVQDNHSLSGARTLRGLHAQLAPHPQAKLIRCIQGAIFDVAVDIRRGSPTFLKWVGYELSAENFHQLFVPEGFAHGFCVLGESAQVEYKCSEFYSPEDEIVVRFDDPAIGVEWPAHVLEAPVLSERDQNADPVQLGLDRLPHYSP
jgi:dTDP-4-dehydrorhamnose 3,5-epimerase